MKQVQVFKKYALRLLFLVGGLACQISCTGAQAELRTEARLAHTEIGRMVQAQYAAIERGDLKAWAAAFSTDVLLLGTDPTEVMSGREAMLAQMNQRSGSRMAAEVRRKYRSRRLQIGIAPSGKAAFLADEIDYSLTSATTNRQVRFRMSGVAAFQNGRWEITVAHFSVPVEDERAFTTTWPIPNDLPARTPSGAEEIAALFPATAQDHFPVPFSDRKDVLLIGTSAQEWISTGAKVQQFTRQGMPSSIEVLRRGELTVGTTEGTDLAWVAWNASLTVTGPKGQHAPVPVRVLSVLLREKAAWRKVQEHVSIGVAD